jgi:hypothetical protein
MERDANYWISLVRKETRDLEVTDCLERHGVVALDAGELVLPDAGVILHLRKTEDPPEQLWVAGVAFVLSAVRGGHPYAGNLPHGIMAADSVLDAGMRLNPAMLLPTRDSSVFEAVYPEHRLKLTFDTKQQLQSCAWLTTRTEPEPLD